MCWTFILLVATIALAVIAGNSNSGFSLIEEASQCGRTVLLVVAANCGMERVVVVVVKPVCLQQKYEKMSQNAPK
jgi:hypothetical protein